MIRILTLLAVCSLLPAQSTGLITGTVADTTGGAVPSARVSATQQGTTLRFAATADQVGRFSFPRLPVGSYVIECRHQGFRGFVSEAIRLDADQTRQAQITLQLGDVTESVQVTGAVGLVETVGLPCAKPWTKSGSPNCRSMAAILCSCNCWCPA